MNQIKPWLFQGKVIIIYGARQVGKTTLAREIISMNNPAVYLNCERQPVKELLSSRNLIKFRDYIGNASLVVFDEAQKVDGIGEILKVLVDTNPDIQFLATGSSSFDLADTVSEPLTGRNVKFILYPLSFAEISLSYDRFQLDEMMENILLYGTYPDIVVRQQSQKVKLLEELSGDYLFRDILKFENLRRSDLLIHLLRALALQAGHEVSLRELSVLLKTTVETIQRYLLLLERSFVIFSLSSLSRNPRNEISKGKKYYFYDLGIRNSLIMNFSPVSHRIDIGQIWENFCVVERMKYNQSNDRKPNMYFWRTYQQQEIDLVEEHSGRFEAFEFKWNPSKTPRLPGAFKQVYPDASFTVVNPATIQKFLLAER